LYPSSDRKSCHNTIAISTVTLRAAISLSAVEVSAYNLFDKVAPLDVQTYWQNNYNINYHPIGAIGRFVALTARYLKPYPSCIG
jgi:hypothetical protein